MIHPNTVVRDEELDCVENAFSFVASTLGRRFELMFANSWFFDFSHVPDLTVGDRVIPGPYNSIELLEHYHAIKVVTNLKDSAFVKLDKIRENLSKGIPVLLDMKSRNIPWDTFYGREDLPYEHLFVISGINESEKCLICTDVWYSKSGLKLPFTDLLKDEFAIITLEITGDEKEVNLEELIEHSMNHFLSGNHYSDPIQAMTALADEIKNLNLDKEFEGHQPLLPPHGPPLCNNLFIISDRRTRFSVFLKFIGLKYNSDGMLEMSKTFKKVAEGWKVVTGILFKAYYSRERRTLLLTSAGEKIKEVAMLEQELLRKIRDYRFNDNKHPVTSIAAAKQHPDSFHGGNIIFCDLKPYFNNKGFQDDSGNLKADFTGTGEFFLTEGLPRERFWQVGTMAFEFPMLQIEQYDNISCDGQQITIQSHTAQCVMILGSGDWGSPSEKITVLYVDNDTEEIIVEFSEWVYKEPIFGELKVWTGKNSSQDDVSIFANRFFLTKPKAIKSIKFPCSPSLHIFALSLGY